MNAITTLADALDAGSHALRRIDRTIKARRAASVHAAPVPTTPATEPAVAERPTAAGETAAQHRAAFRGQAAEAAKTAKLPASHPVGYWRCTSSKFPEFLVGFTYRCVIAGDGSARVRPSCGGTWAPYWSEASKRFCYPASELDFEWVGEKPTTGCVIDTRTSEDVISERRQASSMTNANGTRKAA